MNDVAVPIDPSNTEIRGTGEHCLRAASFCQHDGLVMRKRQALCIARLANIFQTEFLDRCFVSDLLFIIFCVVENFNICTAIPRGA